MHRFSQYIEEFKPLWRIEEKEWKARRAYDWDLLSRKCYKEEPKVSLRHLKRYFLRGELIGDYIPPVSAYLCTPVNSPNQARMFVLSHYFSTANTKKTVLSQFVRNDCASVLDWYPEHVKYLSEGLLGDTYSELKAKVLSGKMESIQPSATSFCHLGMYKYAALFQGKISYTGYVECFQYLVSALQFVDTGYQRMEQHYLSMIDLAMRAVDNRELPAIAILTAENVINGKNVIARNWQIAKGKKVNNNPKKK